MAGAEAAYDALIGAVYAEHGRALLAYATRLTGDPAAAEDIVQETLIRAWKHPAALTNGHGSVRAWLMTVTLNLVRDRGRARAVRPRERPETAATGAATPSTADHAEQVVVSEALAQAIGELTEDHRDVVRERYLHGASVAQAAVTLGVAEGTVKSRAYYALRELRVALEDIGLDIEELGV